MGQSVGGRVVTEAAGGKVLTNQELKELATKVIKEYKLTEPIDLVMGAISKFFATNPDKVNKLNAVKGASTKKQFEVLNQEVGKRGITENLAQPPRSVRAAAEYKAAQPPAPPIPAAPLEEPFSPPTIVRKAVLDSENVGLSGLAPTIDVVPSGMGGLNNAVDIPLRAPEPNVPKQPASLRGRVAGGTAALGGAAAVGTALTNQEPATISPSSFMPVVDETGKLTMGPEEKKYYEKVGGWQAERKRQAEYDSVQEGIDSEIRSKFTAARMTPPPKDSPTYRAEAAKIIQARFKPAPAAPKPEDIPADEQGELPGEGPSDQGPLEEPKQAVMPAPGSEGGAPAETTQQDVQTLTQGKLPPAGSQENLTTGAQDIFNKRQEFRSALGGLRTVDRSELIDAIKSLDTVEEELKKIAAEDPSKIPQLKDIVEARRAALDAYKEKASMNEWLSIADRAINAIGQFAAGRAALGTPYTSTYRPGVTDYGAKTEQAMRELQAETGILEKERAESEQAVAAYERKQEKLADRIRRQRESKVRLLEEDVRRQERDIDKADKLTADLMDNWLQTQRIENQYKKDIEREKRGEARTQAEQDRAREGVLQKDIDSTNKLIKALISFDSSSKKTTEAGLTKIAVELGTDKESLIQGIVNLGEKEVDIPPRKEGMIGLLDESDKSWLKGSLIPTLLAEAKARRDRLDKEQKMLEQKRTGQQPAAAAAPAPAAIPTRQQPPATGTIKVRVGNQVGEIPANQLEAFKAKYPDSEVVQ